MADSQFEVAFERSGRGKAQCPPNPDYPEGVDVDTGERPSCTALVPYPAPECGTWIIWCRKCGVAVACTAAGRPDDPRSMAVPCTLGVTQ